MGLRFILCYQSLQASKPGPRVSSMLTIHSTPIQESNASKKQKKEMYSVSQHEEEKQSSSCASSSLIPTGVYLQAPDANIRFK